MIKLFKNILIVSPHPDDSEYSCYGLIQKLETKTTILICSAGGAGDSTNEDDRLDEVIDFWENNDDLDIVICKELLQSDYHEIVKYFDNLIDENKFDAIFIPPEKDTNQEHRLISNIGKSSLRNKGCAVFEYWTPSTTHEWQPNIWLDISEFFDEKNTMLRRCFKSQQKKSYFQESYIDLFHQDWQAFKKDVQKCEKYKLTSWVCK